MYEFTKIIEFEQLNPQWWVRLWILDFYFSSMILGTERAKLVFDDFQNASIFDDMCIYIFFIGVGLTAYIILGILSMFFACCSDIS